MLILVNEITVGSAKWSFITDVKTESGFESLTDTCTITMPQKVRYKGRPLVQGGDALFKPGDKVSVSLGYTTKEGDSGTLKQVFNGYLRKVEPNVPLVLHCEDAMYLLKKKVVESYSGREVTLGALVAQLVGASVPIKVIDPKLNIGRYRITKKTVAEVFDDLKKEYGLYSFMRQGILYVGFPYSNTIAESKIIKLDFQNNVLSSQLEYKRADEQNLRVEAISINDDGTRTKATAGNDGGEVRTLHFRNIGKTALQKMADDNVLKLRYEGYKGTLTTFGEPFALHTDKVELTDARYPERNGKYGIKKVVRTFGMGGYRQDIELGQKF